MARRRRRHRGNYSQADVYSLVRRNGGSDREARQLASVVPPESGGRLNVENSIGAFGLFQIYDGKPGAARRLRGRPNRQAKEALAKLRAAGGLGPWVSSKGGWQPFHGKGSGRVGSDGGGTLTTPGRSRVDISRQTTFDAAAYEKARKAAIVGQLIAKRKGTGGVLFKTGVLSTTPPHKSEFTDSRLVSKIVRGKDQSMTVGGPGGLGGGGRYKHGVGPHGSPNLLIQLGHLAQKYGLRVSENPNFGGVGGGHVPGSYHYKNEAFDASGSAKAMARFARAVQRRYGRHLAELIHNSPYGAFAIKHGRRVPSSVYSGVWAGHRNHVHLAVGRGGQGAD